MCGPSTRLRLQRVLMPRPDESLCKMVLSLAVIRPFGRMSPFEVVHLLGPRQAEPVSVPGIIARGKLDQAQARCVLDILQTTSRKHARGPSALEKDIDFLLFLAENYPCIYFIQQNSGQRYTLLSDLSFPSEDGLDCYKTSLQQIILQEEAIWALADPVYI